MDDDSESVNDHEEAVILRFYDDEGGVIIRSASDISPNHTNGDTVEANDESRFEIKPYDVVIMQLGNTGVGKSSICQALTENLSFRIGTENGTTIIPRASVIKSNNNIQTSTGEQLRQVLIDVPGLNQAVIAEKRRLFVQHPEQPRKKLELEDIEELIVKLAKLMLVCLIVVDQKILNGFEDTYDKVLTLLVKGVRESDPSKYENINDDVLRNIVKKRIIFVRNKCDHIYDHKNAKDMIVTEENNIRQKLKLTDEPIHFLVAGAYSASKGQGNFSKEAADRLNKPQFLTMISELKKTINKKVQEHAQALINQLEARNTRDCILKEAATLGLDRIRQRHKSGHQIITMFANVPNATRCVYNSIMRNHWKIGYGMGCPLKRNVPLHEHPLKMFLGWNKRDRYVCQVCGSRTDQGEFMQTWWYCKNPTCRDADGKWYVVHEECAEIYEETCNNTSTESL